MGELIKNDNLLDAPGYVENEEKRLDINELLFKKPWRSTAWNRC